jgi:hypothetical protein
MKLDGIIRAVLLFASFSSARRVKPYKCPEMPWSSVDFRNASVVQVLAEDDGAQNDISGHDRFGHDLFRLGFGLIDATTKGAAVHVTQSLRAKYAAALPCLLSTQGFDDLKSSTRQYTVARAPLLQQTGAYSAVANVANHDLLQQAFQIPCAFEEGSHAGRDDIVIYFSTYEAQRTGDFSVGLDHLDSETMPERNLLDPRSHLLARVPVAFYDAILTAHLAKYSSPLPRPRVFVVCDPAHVQHSTVQYLVEKYGALLHSSVSGMARAPGHLEAWSGFQRDFCFLLGAPTVVLSPSWFGWMGTSLSSIPEEQVVHVPILPWGGPMPWCELVVFNDARYVYHDVVKILRPNSTSAAPGQKRHFASSTFESAHDAKRACDTYARHQHAHLSKSIQMRSLYRPLSSPADSASMNVSMAPVGNVSDDVQLAEALRVGGGLYRPSFARKLPQDWVGSLQKTVLAVSCNYAVRDLLLNWACHAERLGLNFVLLPMDAELAAAARGSYAQLFPAIYFSHTPPAGYQGGSIRPNTQSGWRRGQFNEVSYYKLAAVAAILNKGYRVVFSDVDIVFVTDPMPALFPFKRGAPSDAGVLLPLADFAYQQNEGTWDPTSVKGWGSPRPKEGNSGFYVMASSRATRLFLATALARCIANPGQDDQANLFNELLYSSLVESRAVHCVGGESNEYPVFNAYMWNHSGLTHSSSSLSLSLSTNASAWVPYFSACPLPMLSFASGFAHQGKAQGVAEWKHALNGFGAQAVLLHFNYLRGHDKKRERMEASGMWVWDDGEIGRFGANSGPEGGTCVFSAQNSSRRDPSR